ETIALLWRPEAALVPGEYYANVRGPQSFAISDSCLSSFEPFVFQFTVSDDSVVDLAETLQLTLEPPSDFPFGANGCCPVAAENCGGLACFQCWDRMSLPVLALVASGDSAIEHLSVNAQSTSNHLLRRGGHNYRAEFELHEFGPEYCVEVG